MMGRPVHGPAHKRTGGQRQRKSCGPKNAYFWRHRRECGFSRADPQREKRIAFGSDNSSRTNTQRVSGRSGSTELSFSADFPRGLTLKIAMSSVLFDILATYCSQANVLWKALTSEGYTCLN